MEYTVVLIPTTIRTRALVSRGPDELLRALLPAPSQVRRERATVTFLEGLSLWLDARLRVVLCVDAQQASFCLGLTDEMGRCLRSVFYAVEVRERGVRRQREHRIRGLGDFVELRQQRMTWPVPNEE